MFQLAYTAHVLPFVASLLITGGLGIYAYRRRHLPMVATFMWLMAALTLWTCCYIVELASVTPAGKIFWASAKYFGAAPGPALWFVLAIQLTRNDRLLTRPFQMFLAAWSIATIFVVFTNDVHHWYWTDIWLADGFPETQVEHGFYFWIYAVGTYLFILLGVWLIVQYYRTTPPLYRQQALLMSLGGFIPLGGRILEDFFGIDFFPLVDNVILLLLLSGIFFALAIFRYGALDIVHIAHDVIIDTISAGIIVVDRAARVIELNPYARVLVDPALLPAIGRPLGEVLPAWADLDVASRPEQERAVMVAGSERYFQLQISPLRIGNDALAGHAIVLFDITARKEAERQLAALARTDPLTGVMNRRSFFEQAEPELARSQRYGRPLALLIFDVDHFKQVNDTYGHSAGDQVLRVVASLFQRSMRQNDLLARYGGEEFVCLLVESGGAEAQQSAERLRQLVAQTTVDSDQQALQVTISIGLATLEPEQSLAMLIERADQALYTAKRSGRNRVVCWEPAMAEQQ